MYRTVRELTEDEFDELRQTYFYQLLDEGSDVLGDAESPYDIPREVVLTHYDGISFTEDDFFCNQEVND